jgi:hypothetical protein
MAAGPSTDGDRSRSGGTGRRLWRSLVWAIGLALFAAYVGSYYHLSRQGMREAKLYGMKGFLYVPVAEALAEKDLSRHHALARFYAPLNWVDQALFGSDGPGRGFTWGLSK